MILKMNPFFGGCASNKEKCIIKFTDDKAGAFQGIVVDKNNKIQYNLRGSWKKNIEMKYINEDRWKTLWEIDSSEKYLENGISLKSTRKYYLPRFSYELNNGRGVLRNYLRDTDSRLRKDIIEYEEGNPRRLARGTPRRRTATRRSPAQRAA